MHKLRLFAIFVVLWASSVLMALSVDPMLMLNTEMHTAAIGSISVDASERTVLTSSFDKTARLWDLESGELLRILRPPLSPESRNILFAGALSPDGRIAVLGGCTYAHYLYIFDTASGTISNSIGAYPTEVLDLEFSPDGKYLALGLGAEGVRIIRCSDWTEVQCLDEYADRVESLDFDASGNLATVCYDGKLRFYNPEFKLIRERSFEGNPHLVEVAFSPDGSLIAVGGTQKQVEILSSADLHTLYQPVITGSESEGNEFFVVSFSADGKELYAGGYYKQNTDSGWRRSIRVWQDGGRGSYADHPVSGNTITDIKSLTRGGFLFSGSYPDWGRITSEGELKPYKKGETYDFRDEDRSTLKVNNNGEQIGFTPLYESPMCFQLTARALKSGQCEDPSYSDCIAGFAVTDWKFSTCPKLNGTAVDCLLPNEVSFAADIAPDEKRVLLGTTWRLLCLDEAGKLLWKKQTLAMVCAVKVSGNGMIVVTALSDGTLRWYKLSDGTLLLTMYPHNDGKRWIIYTPKGYYDCAPGSESLIGWHVNNGSDREGQFFPVARFRSEYYRPDVIDRILTTLDEEEALQQANEAAGITTVVKGIEQILPPSISITSPSHNSGFSSETVTIEYNLTNLREEQVKSIRLLLDGRPHKIYRDPAQESLGKISITLPPKNVRIGLIAENKFGSSEMAEVKLLWKGNSAVQQDAKPNLYVLVIGINEYQVEELKLRYSAKDASDFAQTINLQNGLMYDTVKLRLLTDSNASRDGILEGLDWLQQQCTANDVAMIFLSGHGANDKVGLFYYLPVGADVTKLKSTCVPFSDFQNTLSSIPGKVILFADACHSGGIYSESQARLPDLNRFINELSSAEVGVVIFTSSTPRQSSLESDTWQNGAFTKALVEGLLGDADFMNKGRISVKELDLYISSRVKDLTAGQQTPTTIVPQSIPDFDIGMVP